MLFRVCLFFKLFFRRFYAFRFQQQPHVHLVRQRFHTLFFSFVSATNADTFTRTRRRVAFSGNIRICPIQFPLQMTQHRLMRAVGRLHRASLRWACQTCTVCGRLAKKFYILVCLSESQSLKSNRQAGPATASPCVFRFDHTNKHCCCHQYRVNVRVSPTGSEDDVIE